MEQSQIVRFPKKYRELISSLSDEKAWKLFKKILWEDTKLEWELSIYFWFINSDLENLEKSALNWGKWGRPKDTKPQVITPGYDNTKPQDTKSDNLKGSREEVEVEKEDKKEVEVEIEKIINFWNEELHRKYEITKELKEAYQRIIKKYDKDTREEVIFKYVSKCKKMDKEYHLSPYKFFTQKNGFISIKNS